MNGFVEWLDKLNKKDTKIRAVLRRSLAFSPGTYIPAYPYVEPFLKDEVDPWRREVHYLVAGLWAAHWREGRTGTPVPIGKACAIYQTINRSASTERRFIALLDSDSDQLPHHLRQMTALLKEQNIDFGALLQGLLFWKNDQKHTQNAWARDFYRGTNYEIETELVAKEDKNI